MKYFLVVFFTLFFASLTPSVTHAETLAGSSATLASPQVTFEEDKRVKLLEKFLQSFDSPLAPYARAFVNSADAYSLDWKLVASISGVESTFGKQLPGNSYNAWGWGIYGDNIIRFKSYDDAIETISKGIRQKYMDKWGARDVYQIGRYYAASPTWAQRVAYFMSQIKDFSEQNPSHALSISI